MQQRHLFFQIKYTVTRQSAGFLWYLGYDFKCYKILCECYICDSPYKLKQSPALCVLLMHNYSSMTAASIMYMYLIPSKPMMLHGQVLLTYKYINLDSQMECTNTNQTNKHTTYKHKYIQIRHISATRF